jgi:hypothetical protein
VADPLEFAELMSAGEPPLDRTLAVIAAFGRPEVVPEELLDRLDAIARDRGPIDPAELCAELFATPGGFAGNRTNYYDPGNSLLDIVLRRRTGIPISLAVVAIETGRRLGTDLLGVGMPGHFLLRDASEPDVFFDPFDEGRRLDAEGCRALFDRLHGGALAFDPSHLAPTPSSMIVRRVLNNLQGAYQRRGDRPGLVRALSLQAAVPGAPVAVRRHLADLLAADGRFDDAADERERLALEDPGAGEDHLFAARRLRARLN